MVPSRSRSISPPIGVATRRTMAHGFPLSRNDHRERSGPLSATIPAGSSESSAKSTERSPSTDSSGGGLSQSDSTSRIALSRNTDERKTVDTSAGPMNQLHLQLRNAQRDQPDIGTVEEVVYRSAQSLKPLTSDDEFTLFRDEARTMIVVKWMRFYKYYPNDHRDTDKIRRDELKARLKIPPGTGQKLGSFIINKFNNFVKWGYICWDDMHHVVYHPSTDAWLIPTWDGHIERQQIATQRDTRSTNTQRVVGKRQASASGQQREKRQKSMEERRTASPVTPQGPLSNDVVKSGALLDPLPSQDQFMTNDRTTCDACEAEPNTMSPGHQNEPQGRTNTNGIRREKTHGSRDGFSCAICSTNHTKIRTITLDKDTIKTILGQPPDSSKSDAIPADKIHNRPVVGKDVMPDPQELSQRLNAANSQGTIGMTNDNSDTNPPFGAGQRTVSLANLRAQEKSCIQVLRESTKELESIREKHNTLWQQSEVRKADLRLMIEVVEQNSSRQKTVAPATTLGGEADLAESLQDILQTRMKNDNFLRTKQEEMSSLLAQIGETAEAKSNLKLSIAAKKIELEDLQREIKSILKFNARFTGKGRVLLDKWDSLGGNARPRTVSPVESVPGSVSSEVEGADQLIDEDNHSELSDEEIVEL
ncbi:hypothetical protein V8E51_007620 [Hyaloscypha variabilis]